MGRQCTSEVDRSFHTLYDIRTDSKRVYKVIGLTFACTAVIFTAFQPHVSPMSVNMLYF